ncbi:hypothetical protein BDV19DRAFT_339051 [Aspergillus venezuelensis]
MIRSSQILLGAVRAKLYSRPTCETRRCVSTKRVGLQSSSDADFGFKLRQGRQGDIAMYSSTTTKSTMESSNSLLPSGPALTSYSLRRSGSGSVSGASLRIAITALHYTATTRLQHRSPAPEPRKPRRISQSQRIRSMLPKMVTSVQQGTRLPACLRNVSASLRRADRSAEVVLELAFTSYALPSISSNLLYQVSNCKTGRQHQQRRAADWVGCI